MAPMSGRTRLVALTLVACVAAGMIVRLNLRGSRVAYRLSTGQVSEVVVHGWPWSTDELWEAMVFSRGASSRGSKFPNGRGCEESVHVESSRRADLVVADCAVAGCLLAGVLLSAGVLLRRVGRASPR